MSARIVLNALALRPGGSGVQTYERELIKALAGSIDAHFAAVVQRDAVDELPEGVEALSRPPCDGVRRSLAGLRSCGRADLVHGLDVDLPLRPGAPTVATVHDLSLLDVPWAYRRLKRAGKWLTNRVAIRRADVVISVSAFTAERVLHHFGRDSVVVNLAPAPGLGPAGPDEIAAARERYGLPEAFVLHVGNLEPRKDVPVLAAACLEADVPLLLAGSSLTGAAAPLGARRLGYVDAADLPALYGAATVVAYVSRYEGFGLPPLEAMACGATVMASRVGALPDLADGAIEWVPAGDSAAQAAALRRLLSDGERRSELSRAGVAAVAALSWEQTARRTVEVYRTLGVS